MKCLREISALVGAAALMAAAVGCPSSKGHRNNDDEDGSGGGGGNGGGENACEGIAIESDGALDLDIRTSGGELGQLGGAVTLNGGPLPDVALGRGSLLFSPATEGGVLSTLTVGLGTAGSFAYDVQLAPGRYDVLYSASDEGCLGAPAMPCNGGPVLEDVEVSDGGVLDIDIRAVTVEGNVTVNGAIMPGASSDRGALTFELEGGGTATTESFGASGAASYSLRLLAGRYSISFDASSNLCGVTPVAQVPCNGGVVESDIELATNGALDIDLHAVTVQGAVTVNGATMPSASGNRGGLSFGRGDEGGEAMVSLGASGAASYTLTILAGTYDIDFAGNESLCDTSVLPVVPCNAGRVKTSQQLTTSSTLNLDLPAITVQGSVLVNGAAMPSASGPRGSLDFAMAGGDGLSTKSLGTSGAASYQLRLLAGSYAVRFEANDSLCDGTTPPPVPCNGAVVLPDVTLNSSVALDVDVPAVSVQGRVLVNGAAMPAASGSRGSLRFELDGEDSIAIGPFPPTGPASYAVTLVPGTYDVSYEGNASLCTEGSLPEVPCNSATILDGQALDSNGALDVDLVTVTVQGNVTANGAPMPAAPLDRGALSFALDEGDAISTRSFGANGPASYALHLLAGSYSVSFEGNESLCQEALVALPCNGGPVVPSIELMSSGALDVDVPVAIVQGNVTLNGDTMPNAAGERGAILFEGIEATPLSSKSLGMQGPASYGVALLKGRYIVHYQANPSLCLGGQTSGLPCTDQVLLGCP